MSGPDDRADLRAPQKADTQIAELIRVLSTAGESALARPCPGREKLGDGTVGAIALHVADNYHRLASIVAAALSGHDADGPARHAGAHPTAKPGLDQLLARLDAAREALAFLGELSDEQLGLVPSARDMRFVDGRRTVDEIVTGVLRHQQHQLDAIRATLAST